MSDTGQLKPELTWDKFQPGRLKYTLGSLELLHDGIVINQESKIKIPKGQTLILLRNFILYYPRFCQYELLVDRLWPDPDTMPLWHMNILKGLVSELYRGLPAVGAKMLNKAKFGYRLELIEGWRSDGKT